MTYISQKNKVSTVNSSTAAFSIDPLITSWTSARLYIDGELEKTFYPGDNLSADLNIPKDKKGNMCLC